MRKKFAFLGVGNMAGAIIGGITGDGVSPDDIALYDKFPTQYKPYDGRGFVLTYSVTEAIAAADIIFLAVKPQNFSELLTACRAADLKGKCFVSIAAGISTEYICRELQTDAAVIRTMPNTPLLIGQGVTAICRNASVTDGDFSVVCRIFSRMGMIFTLPEDKMNAIIAATSSAPAYIIRIIRDIVSAAIRQGIEMDESVLLEAVTRMTIGSAQMILKTGKTPDELIRMVTSPGGTTAEALRVFDERLLTETIADAMEACTHRADELGAR